MNRVTHQVLRSPLESAGPYNYQIRDSPIDYRIILGVADAASLEVSLGTFSISRIVYGSVGCSSTSVTAPVSTTTPCERTTTDCEIERTNAKLCVMNSIDRWCSV